MTYRPGLDGLRAVAVLLVLIFHVAQPHRFAGFVGVDIFFTLSGFLITTILLDEFTSTGSIDLRSFYIRRLLRLYPALIAVLIVWTPAFTWIVPSAGASTAAKDAVVAATYTGNVYMTWRGTWLGPFTHTWSLALEEQYYLVWPLLLVFGVRRVKRQRLAAVCLVVAAVAAGFTLRQFRYGAASYPLESTSLGLLFGSALALASGRRWLRPMTGRSAAAAGALLLAAELVVFSVTTALPSGLYVVVSVLASGVLVSAVGGGSHDGPVTRVLSVGWLRRLGVISYGIYLWHYPIALACDRALHAWAPLERFPVVAIASTAAASISYRFVERPFLRLKNRFEPASRRLPVATDGRRYSRNT